MNPRYPVRALAFFNAAAILSILLFGCSSKPKEEPVGGGVCEYVFQYRIQKINEDRKPFRFQNNSFCMLFAISGYAKFRSRDTRKSFGILPKPAGAPTLNFGCKHALEKARTSPSRNLTVVFGKPPLLAE